MSRTHKHIRVVAVAAALIASACSGAPESDASASDGADEPLQIAMLYDISGRGDQSFNDSAAEGLDRAVAELGIDVIEAEASPGESDAAKVERLRAVVDSGADAVVAIGFSYSGPVEIVASEAPDVRFAIVDDAAAEGPNVANLLFAENEGSFLVGAAAAMKSETGKIGFIGGVDVPHLHRFRAGYEAGARAVTPDIEVDVRFLTQPPDFSGFGDPAKARVAATGMFDSGLDVVYCAAGGSASGAFMAAATAGGYAIGVDSDQYESADPSVRDAILTSMLKRLDVAVFDYIESGVEGDFPVGHQTYDLASEGVGYATSGGGLDDIAGELEAFVQDIVSGRVEVPTE